MSKPKRSTAILSKPSGFGVLKSNDDIKTDATEQVIIEQEHKLPQDITFTHAMQDIQISIAQQLTKEAFTKLNKCTEELLELGIQQLETISSYSSENIIEYVEKQIAAKVKLAEILSWGGFIANISNHLVTSLDVTSPDDFLDLLAKGLEHLIEMFDNALNSIPNISILGITLSPDQKQVSETKSLISGTLAKIDKIKQEIAEGYEDWGAAEQSAYERLTDDSTDFVSGAEVMDWIEQLKTGADV